MGYVKNVAVIKEIKDGFSADGGPLSGLVKAEKYSDNLSVEISLINFAPLTEGRYVAAISDGTHFEIIENCAFEGCSKVDITGGFACVICYVHSGVRLLASAVAGGMQSAALPLKSAIESAEAAKSPPVETACTEYEDEALAEDNYYEFQTPDAGGEPVCENPQKEADGVEFCQNEEDTGAVQESASEQQSEQQLEFQFEQQPEPIKLAGGGFFQTVREEVENILSTYPPCEELCAATDGARWVKISYGDDKFYVFGLIEAEGTPRYICYGVPSSNAGSPPASMEGKSSFLPVKTQHGLGFWVMYQDADTGASVTVSSN